MRYLKKLLVIGFMLVFAAGYIVSADKIVLQKTNYLGNMKLKSVSDKIYDVLYEQLSEQEEFELVDEDKVEDLLDENFGLDLYTNLLIDEAQEINSEIGARYFISGNIQSDPSDDRYFKLTLIVYEMNALQELSLENLSTTRSEDDIRKMVGEKLINTLTNSASEGAKKYFDIAIDNIKKKDYNGAIEPLQTVLKLDPEHAKAHFWLGYSYSKQYEESLQSGSDDLFDLDGGLSEKKGDPELLNKAVTHLEKSIELDPEYDTAYSTLGYVYISAGRMKDALNAFERYFKNNPDNAQAAINIALLFEKEMDDFENAKTYYEKAIAISDSIDYHKKYLDAIEDRKDWDLFVDRIKILMKHPDFNDMDKFLKADLISKATLNLQKEGKYDQAAKFYEEWSELSPNDPTLYFSWGKMYEDNENYDEAISKYQKSIEIDPEYTRAYVTLATVYIEKKDFSNASKYAKKALEKDAKESFAYKVLGDIEFDKALPIYNKYIDLNKEGKEKDGLAKKVEAFEIFKNAWIYYVKSLNNTTNSNLADYLNSRLKDMKGQLMNFPSDEKFFLDDDQKSKIEFGFSKNYK